MATPGARTLLKCFKRKIGKFEKKSQTWGEVFANFGNAHVVRVLASHEQGGAVVELQIQNHEDRVFRIRDDHVLAVVRASRWGDDDEETDGETDGETEDETDSETGDEGSETD